MPRAVQPPRLWQHPNGVWYVRVAGTGRVSTGTKDRDEANAFFARFVAGLTSPAPPPSVTVSAIIDGYLRDRAGRVRSLDRLEYAAKPLKAELGLLSPDDLTTGVMRDYAARRRKAGRKDGTIMREVVTLRAAVHWAAAERWIPPPAPIAMPVKAPPPRARWLTREEAGKLIAGAIAHHMRLFIQIALMTGARSGAILSLTWDRVDFEARLIDYGPGHGNKRRPVVPISDALMEPLKEAAARRTTDYVIEYKLGPVQSIKKGFRDAAKRAGLRGVTPHVLRHTAATWAIQAGVPIAQVARMLGDTEAVVERVYGKHSPDYLRRAVDAIAVSVQ